MAVLLLPTDPPEMADFMLEMVNANPLVEYIRDEETGLLVKQTDKRVAEVGEYKTRYKYNSVKFFGLLGLIINLS